MFSYHLHHFSLKVILRKNFKIKNRQKMATMVQKCCVSIVYLSKKVKNGARMVQGLVYCAGEGKEGFWYEIWNKVQ